MIASKRTRGQPNWMPRLPDDDPAGNVAPGVARSLATIRAHLGMDVAFVSEFEGNRRHIRFVEGGPENPIRRNDTISLAEGYCLDVVEGRLPELIPDTGAVPLAASKRITRAFPIGAHISVPLRLSDGRLYGTFCCFSTQPDPSLTRRDLQIMYAFADLIAHQIEDELRAGEKRDSARHRIEALLRSGAPAILYQPIARLSDRRVVGAEALARFTRSGDARPPNEVFEEAASAGLGPDLELQAIRNAIEGFRPVWARQPNLRLGVNISPDALMAGEDLGALVESCRGHRLVLEVTEHRPVDDYARLLAALQPLRERGVAIAVDDAGAGYASLRHVLAFQPGIIKLDLAMIRGIDEDPLKRALATAVVVFGKEAGCQIVAEGVETGAEWTVLRDLGVFAAQGYHLDRPLPVETFLSRHA